MRGGLTKRRVAACVGLGLLMAAVPSRAEVPEPPALSVEDAVAATLGAQPRLRAAEDEVKAAAARARQAAWKRIGTVDTTGLVTPAQRPLRIDFPGIPNLVPPTSFEVKQLQTYALSATLTQPLFTWGALENNQASAEKETAASRGSRERLRQQLVLEASQAFLTAATAGAGVRVAEEALAQQQAFARAAQSRMEAGSAARLDVLKAELTVSEAEAALLAARNREKLAREALVTLTLDERFRTATLQGVGDSMADLPAETAAVARALAARPDLEALRRQGEGLGLRVRAVRGAALPALALRASLTQQNEELSRVFAKSGQVYQVSLALNWDATAPLRHRSQLAEVLALQDAVVQGLRATEEAVALQVRTALLDAGEARQQVRVAEGALATAEEQARVARLAYAEGALSTLEARDADLGLTNARFNSLRARLDLALAEARLRFALGD